MSNSTIPAGGRAAVYIRMSTNQQEDSPERQRSQVTDYAKRHGYQIIREYKDEGIAGDHIKRRTEFCQMLADAQRKQFDVILCDDKDRFGRFDSLELGEIASPLRRVGVYLETVAQGRIDWDSFHGRINDAVLQECRKMEAQAISRRVLTGLKLRVDRGEYVPSFPPYGYKKQVVEGGKKKLVPDPDQAKVVAWMFEQVAERHLSASKLAEALTERGATLPKGSGGGRRKQFLTKKLNAWNKLTVRKILRNRVYLGDTVWNRSNGGGYSELRGSQVVTRDRKTKPKLHREAEMVVIPQTHEAIVDRDLFERVQTVLTQNKKYTSPTKPGGGDYVLSKVLVCGHCGSALVGTMQQKKRVYICGAYVRMGNGACNRNRVQEDYIVERLVPAIQAYCRERLTEVRACIAKEIRATANVGREDLARLRREIADLSTKIERGGSNLLVLDATADADLFAQLRKTLNEWTTERKRKVAELDGLERGTVIRDLEQIGREAEEVLWNLCESLDNTDRDDIRAVIRESVSKVVLHFTHGKRGNWVTSQLARGEITFRPQTLGTSNSIIAVP